MVNIRVCEDIDLGDGPHGAGRATEGYLADSGRGLWKPQRSILAKRGA